MLLLCSAARTAANTVMLSIVPRTAHHRDSFFLVFLFLHPSTFCLSPFPLRNLVFYDVGSPKARALGQELKININLNKRSLSTRLWEIRISQIPFSSKAPSGCLQHFTGIEGKYLLSSLTRFYSPNALDGNRFLGIIQTFNFADNGRHLANQHYKSCVRQEKGRCSIQYEPCNDQSFRIGPRLGNGMPGGMGGGPGYGGTTLSDLKR